MWVAFCLGIQCVYIVMHVLQTATNKIHRQDISQHSGSQKLTSFITTGRFITITIHVLTVYHLTVWLSMAAKFLWLPRCTEGKPSPCFSLYYWDFACKSMTLWLSYVFPLHTNCLGSKKDFSISLVFENIKNKAWLIPSSLRVSWSLLFASLNSLNK